MQGTEKKTGLESKEKEDEVRQTPAGEIRPAATSPLINHKSAIGGGVLFVTLQRASQLVSKPKTLLGFKIAPVGIFVTMELCKTVKVSQVNSKVFTDFIR